jgi:ADP-heptose synthase, bifunctional sugar kinase/adenylyltransferase
MRVAVIGDTILDEYAFGIVERISPEAPVPVFLYKSSKFMPGAAANVALNLVRLGLEVFLFGIIGEDEDGERLINLCEDMGINFRFYRGNLRTLKKTRLLAKHHHVLRIDYEEKFPESEAYGLLDLINVDVDAVIVSNYDKGTVIPETLNFVREKFSGKLKAIDPKSLIWEAKGFDIVKPNLSELSFALHRKLDSIEDVLQGSREVFDVLKPEAMVSTMGDRGMWIITSDKEIYVPAYRREVYDITGAGDTVLAWVVWGKLKKMEWGEIGRWAAKAAAVSVSKLGAYAPTLEEVLKEFPTL